MDENKAGYRMMAPGRESAARSYELPSRDDGARSERPRVDDYRTDIDFETQEMVGGVVYDVMGADLPHAQRNGELDFLLKGLAASGYVVASDLKTRIDGDDDFATDSSIVRKGTDPKTGTRYLENLAFEVVDKQKPSVVDEKAPRMIARGVHRVFAVFLKTGRVKEWSKTKKDWVTLHPSSVIEDTCLVEPLEVAAVLDAAKADDAVVRGLDKKGNREIQRIREESENRGETRGRLEALKEAVLESLEERGLDVAETVREAVLSCEDTHLLKRWARRAVTVARAEDVLLPADP